MSVRPSSTPRGRRPPPPSDGRPAVAVGVPVLLPPLGALSVHGPPSRPRPEDGADTGVGTVQEQLLAAPTIEFRPDVRSAKDEANQKAEQYAQQEAQAAIAARKTQAGKQRVRSGINANPSSRQFKIACQQAFFSAHGAREAHRRRGEAMQVTRTEERRKRWQQEARQTKRQHFQAARVWNGGPRPGARSADIAGPSASSASAGATQQELELAKEREEIKKELQLAPVETLKSAILGKAQVDKMLVLLLQELKGVENEHGEGWLAMVTTNMLHDVKAQIKALAGTEVDGQMQGGCKIWGDVVAGDLDEQREILSANEDRLRELDADLDNFSKLDVKLKLEIAEAVEDLTQICLMMDKHAERIGAGDKPGEEFKQLALNSSGAQSEINEIVEKLAPAIKDVQYEQLVDVNKFAATRRTTDAFGTLYPALRSTTQPSAWERAHEFKDVAAEKVATKLDEYSNNNAAVLVTLEQIPIVKAVVDATYENIHRMEDSAMYFGYEQRHRVALNEVVRIASFLREPAEDDDRVADVWQLHKVEGNAWAGRRMRNFTADRTIRGLYTDCAYETLLWYYGGDQELQKLPLLYRSSIADALGREVVFADGEDSSQPLDSRQQAQVRSAGMNRLCMKMDTLILCTQDAVTYRKEEGGDVIVSDYDVNDPRPQDSSLRSEEWKKSVELLCISAMNYCYSACRAGGHNQLFVKDNGDRLWTPDSDAGDARIRNVAFAMPGQIVPEMQSLKGPELATAKETFAPPFSWPQSVWLSKQFSLIEALVLDQTVPGIDELSGGALRAARNAMEQEMMYEGDASLSRKYNATETLNVMSRQIFGATVPGMVDGKGWQERATKANCQAAGPQPSDPDYALLSGDKCGYVSRATAWSVAMEIEANPHAAALWTVYLHRLLTLRVLYPDDADHVDEQLLIDRYAEYGVMPTLFQYTADGSGLAETDSSQTAAAKNTQYEIKRGAGGGPEARGAVPNTADAWIFAHPSVRTFRKSAIGKYMDKVFRMARHNWAIRKSRVLELSLCWGHRMLLVRADAAPGAAEKDRISRALEPCWRHSALRKVALQFGTPEAPSLVEKMVGASNTRNWTITAADLYFFKYENPEEGPQSLWATTWESLAPLRAAGVCALRFAMAHYGEVSELFQMGLGALGRMNAPAKALLTAAFAGVMESHAPEATKVAKKYVKKGARALGHATAAVTKSAIEGAMGMASLLPMVMETAVMDLTGIDEEHRLIVSLRNISDVLGKGLDKNVQNMGQLFDLQMASLSKQVKDYYDLNVDEASAFNPASLALQGQIALMVELGFIGAPLEIRIKKEQWPTRHELSDYQQHVKAMAGLMFQNTPVIWHVVPNGAGAQETDAETGEPRFAYDTEEFMWFDLMTTRKALYGATVPTQEQLKVATEAFAKNAETFLSSATMRGIGAAKRLSNSFEWLLKNDAETVIAWIGEQGVKGALSAGVKGVKAVINLFRGGLRGGDEWAFGEGGWFGMAAGVFSDLGTWFRNEWRDADATTASSEPSPEPPPPPPPPPPSDSSSAGKLREVVGSITAAVNPYTAGPVVRATEALAAAGLVTATYLRGKGNADVGSQLDKQADAVKRAANGVASRAAAGGSRGMPGDSWAN